MWGVNMCSYADSYGKDKAYAGKDNGHSCNNLEQLEYMSLLLNLQEREQQFRLQDLAMSYGRA